MPTYNPLDIRIPASKTGVMSLIQSLVAHGATYWVGGQTKPAKIAGLALKFAAAYPICRDSRGRAYDKSVRRAVVSLVVFSDGGTIHWWLLSTSGKGGLKDPSAPDFKASKNAMLAGEHLHFGDYRLMYATKKEPREITDARTNKRKVIFSSTSTWTWQMTKETITEARAQIHELCRQLAWGVRDPDSTPYGIRTYLAQQKRRPLFSGVRSQVIELHRYARDEWAAVLSTWRSRHPSLVSRDGPLAGTLVPLDEVIASLPKMRRLPVYGDTPRTIKSLLPPA